MNCSHCSAKIPTDALTCPYCGVDTPNAAQARALKEQQERHAQQLAAVDAGRARQQALLAVETSSKNAFYASILGVVICCLPAGSVVGIVMGLKARKTAATLGASAPWQSMAAIVLGVFWLGFFTLALVMGAVTEREKAERVAAIRAATKDAASQATLDAATACSLIELTLLEGGAGLKGGAVRVFHCEGKLEVDGDRAVMKDLEYARSTADQPKRVDGCLSRGSRWKVDAIGLGPGCGAARDAGSRDD